MSLRSYELNDIKIKSISIETHAGKGAIVNHDQIVAIDIFEDMTKPTMFATIVLLDTLDLVTKLPIIGEEKIELVVETPGITEPTTFKFRCYQVGEIQPSSNGKGVKYTMQCVSEEHLHNSSIIRYHMDGLISDMVERILITSLKTKKSIFQEKTVGIETLNIPKLKPLAAIDFLRQRAVGLNHKMSPYVFFENQYGFNFGTIQGIFEKGLKEVDTVGREFSFKQNPMLSPERQAESYRSILDFQIIYSGESYKKLQQGAFKMITQTFDLATKKFERIDFNLEEKLSEMMADKKKTISNSSTWMDEFAQNAPQAFFAIKDSTRPTLFTLENIAGKNAFTILLNEDVTRVMVPGDTGLAAGHVVRLNVPEIDGLTSRKKLDTTRTGNYLIVRLRHMISFTQKIKHSIVFDCVQLGR